MKFELGLQNYVEWDVEPVMRIRGKFGYRVILRYMDGSVREQQKSGFATEREAVSARDNTVGELSAGKYVVYSHISVREFFTYWVEEDIQNRVGSSETYATYRSVLKNHIIPMMGTKKMVSIRRSDVQKLYNMKAAYSVGVARLVKTIMNTAMRYAVEKKVIADNPAKDVNLPKKVVSKPYHTRDIDSQKTMTLEQVLCLIEASKDTPIHMQVLFNVLMGLRRSEINGVKYGDVDYINRTLTVRRQLGKKIRSKKEDFAPKTFTKQEVKLKTLSSYRVLPIPDIVFEAILAERKLYEKRRNRKKKDFQDLDYICCSSYGRPRSKDFHWTHYKRILQENNLPDVNWHHLRSTFCTILLKNDFNPKAVSKLMGHAKEIITIDVYGDKRSIIADCVDELQPFIDEMMDDEDVEVIDTSDEDLMADTEEYLP